MKFPKSILAICLAAALSRAVDGASVRRRDQGQSENASTPPPQANAKGRSKQSVGGVSLTTNSDGSEPYDGKYCFVAKSNGQGASICNVLEKQTGLTECTFYEKIGGVGCFSATEGDVTKALQTGKFRDLVDSVESDMETTALGIQNNPIPFGDWTIPTVLATPARMSTPI